MRTAIIAAAGTAWLIFGAGCAGLRARAPEGLRASAAPMPIDHSVLGVSGTRLYGLTLDSAFGPSITSSSIFGSSKADAGGSCRLLRGEAVVWSVSCASIADSGLRPAVYLTCLFRPDDAEAAPLSIALTAPMSGPLRGVYFSPAGVLRLEGTNETESGLALPDTVGFSVLRADSAVPIAFIDQSSTRVETLESALITEAERTALAPLVLVLVQTRDARFALRGQSSTHIGVGPVRVNLQDQLEEDDDATPLPEPPVYPGPRTAFEEHVTALMAMGETDAGRALGLMVPLVEAGVAGGAEPGAARTDR